MNPLTLFALTLVLAPAAQAAPGAEWGLGGTVVPGTWTPLRLELPARSGPWTLEAVSVSNSGRETRVSMRSEAGGLSEQPLYVAAGTRSVRLRFTSAAESFEQELPLAGRLFPGHVIGTWKLDPAADAELADVLLPLEPVKVVSLPPTRWPASPLSYSGLAALVTADPGVLGPARLDALRVWVASGGVLLVDGRLPPGQSLLDQLGTAGGVGRAATVPPDQDWRRALDLRPYGQVRRWGTDFDPPPEPGSFDSPVVKTSLGFVLVWAVGVLAVRRQGLRIPLLWAGLCSGAALLAAALGWTAWDRGLGVHGRELDLGSLGRFTSIQAQPGGRQPPLDWPAAPWALEAWRASQSGWPRVSSERAVFEAFAPAAVREPSVRLRWEGRVRWYAAGSGGAELEDAPAAWRRDEAWVGRVISSYPGLDWLGGVDGSSVWLRPEGVRP